VGTGGRAGGGVGGDDRILKEYCKSSMNWMILADRFNKYLKK